MLDHSGLIEHYKAEKEGADRVENLEELVNAAESFVTQEGFGRDAVALPVNELRQSPASQGLDPSLPMASEPAQGSRPELSGDAQDRLVEGLAGSSTGSDRTGLVVQDTGETMSPLAAFLTHAALESGDNQAQAGQAAIQLMTVHSAKGLEFDCVFITGLEEGLFPHENAMSDYEGLEEERRLMYVAITRARKRLYLSHSQTRMLHGQTRYNLKSRFFDELPEAALKWITPKNPGFGAMPGAGSGGRNASYSGANYPRPAWGNSGIGINSDTFKSPPVPVQKAEPAHGLKAGMKVFHTKFGEGTVTTLEGVGSEARAQVNFPRHGVKWLALSVAKLTPV